MTRFGWIVVGCFVTGIALLALAAYAWRFQSKEPTSTTEQTATTTPLINPAELAIYTSGEYGFSFFYPAQAVVTDAFTSGTQPTVPWRVQSIGTGTPVVRIVSGSEEARVGVSTDARERAACLKAGPAEAPFSVITIASTSWNRFSFDKLGTDDERHLDSYRTLRNGSCYAVEVLSPIQRDVPTIATSSAYTIKDILMSVTFAS